MVSSPTNSQLLTESIAFWTIGLFLLLGRLWSRAILRGSWKKLQADDYMMMGTFSLYTSLLILLQFSSRYATNEFHPGELDGILANPQDVKDRIYGSKIVVGSNQAYLLTLWGVKACLLMLYYRMTRDTVNHTYVKIVIGYVIFGLIAIEVPYFFILCRPFSQYWAMPPNNTQCATYFDYCIIQMVFNVSSDLLMLGIPTPFVVGAKVPPLKRALLVGIFSLGSFVVLAAVLAKYYNFTSANSTVYMIWDVRETSVAVYVANLMCWWPLLRKVFGWSTFLRSSSSRSRESDVIEGFSPTPEDTGSVTKLTKLGPALRFSRPPPWDEESKGYRNLDVKEMGR